MRQVRDGPPTRRFSGCSKVALGEKPSPHPHDIAETATGWAAEHATSIDNTIGTAVRRNLP